ncbi:MAG: carboxymuconolactone decarboxylase family protein, partial [Gloeomargarita sp. SKYG98]|nr:carboxymuconolactone decarboxylase family protein [Gloeomargarita sp. SKYG98]
GFHTRAALQAGATAQEIMETLSVAVMMGGGPALMYATHALDALAELQNPSA